MTHPTIAKYREEMKLPGGATIVLDEDLAALLDAVEAAQPFLDAQAGILACWSRSLDASEHVEAISKWKPIYLAALARLGAKP